MNTANLSDAITAVNELCGDDEVRKLMQDNPKIHALVLAAQDLQANAERVAKETKAHKPNWDNRLTFIQNRLQECRYDISVLQAKRQNQEGLIEIREREIESLNQTINYQANQIIGYEVWYPDLISFYKLALAEKKETIAALWFGIQRRDNLIALRDLGLDLNDKAIANLKNELAKWQSLAIGHGHTPQDVGHQRRPDEAPAATADLYVPKADVLEDHDPFVASIEATLDDTKSSQGDPWSIPEGWPTGMVTGRDFNSIDSSRASITPNSLPFIIPPQRTTVDEHLYGQQHIRRPDRYTTRPDSHDDDDVPDLTSDNDSNTSEVTIVTERNGDEDDSRAWTFVPDDAAAYFEEENL